MEERSTSQWSVDLVKLESELNEVDEVDGRATKKEQSFLQAQAKPTRLFGSIFVFSSVS
jgi:hypothetical protein